MKATPAQSARPNTFRIGGRLRLIENSRGVFVVQVRGGLSDCAVPGLHIDRKKHKLSLEWKALFRHFFTQKRLQLETVKQDPVHTPGFHWPP